jgi:hypothetical protein
MSTSSNSKPVVSKYDHKSKHSKPNETEAEGKQEPGPHQRFAVLGRSRDFTSADWSRVVEYQDDDGVIHPIVIPDRELYARGGDAVMNRLADFGFPVPDKKEARRAIVASILSTNANARLRTVRKLGWNGKDHGQFMLGATSVGDGPERLIPAAELKEHAGKFEVAGTVKEWASKVAALADGNPLLQAVLCIAFVPPLLSPAGREGFGIQLVQDSGQGKSTLQRLASSVYGSWERYVATWSTTVAALDDLSLGHSDTLLVIDEAGSAQDEHKPAGRVILGSIFRISGGMPKARKRMDVVPRLLPAWHTVVLSSSERTIDELAHEAGMTLLDGHRARMIDIPADAGEYMGVFRRLPEDVKSPREFAELIRDITRKYYGSAGRRFIRKLVALASADLAALQARIKSLIDSYLAAVDTDEFAGQDARLAEAFGLIFAAGVLASEFEILPWDHAELLKAVAWAHKAARRLRLKQKRHALEKARTGFVDFLKRSKVKIALVKKEAMVDRKKAAASLGFRRKTNGGYELLLKRKALKSEEPVSAVREWVAVLQKIGFLRRSADGQVASQIRIAGLDQARGERLIRVVVPDACTFDEAVERIAEAKL